MEERSSLTWRTLGEIIHMGNLKGKENEENVDHESAFNILLQIVLPVVLILSFLVTTKIQEITQLVGKDVSEVKKMIEITQLIGTTDISKVREWIIELEKQKLIVALIRVKEERIRHYGLDFVSRKVININDGRLDDPDFKTTSEKVLEGLGDKKSREVETERLFKLVLDEANLSRPITEENKKFVKEEIRDFINRVIEDLSTIQIGVIKEIFQYLSLKSDELDKWDPNLKELRDLYRKAKTSKEKEALIGKFIVGFNERLKSDLEKEGYVFLEKTWEKMRLQF
jgi:hypothetical protein